MSGQISFFDAAEPFKVHKPIRLIETFGGIGSQSKSLENLGVDFEHYRLVEFDEKAVISYNSIHGTNFIPSDITKVSGEDLGIVDTNRYDYLFTYSFPCQDISLAGKRLGLEKGSGTRSGLLWEVERILTECKELSKDGIHGLPNILFMENVPQVLTAIGFPEWIFFLESLGYQNKWEVLCASDFGVPQHRERAFMISWLGDGYYDFPEGVQSNICVQDYAEPESVVDEKYYLSKRAVKGLTRQMDRPTNPL